jgi:hypothetical protein
VRHPPTLTDLIATLKTGTPRFQGCPRALSLLVFVQGFGSSVNSAGLNPGEPKR